jgi:hypothetical protein
MDLDKEKFAFALFYELYNNLAKGIKTEGPDFIINQNGIRIGVEHVDFMEESKENEISVPVKYSLEDKVVRYSNEDFDKHSDKRIVANIQFQDDLKLRSKRIKELALEISNRIQITVKDFPNIIYHKLEVTDNLPAGVLHIYFDIAPYLDKSIFQAMRSKWIGKFNLNDLNRLISKKEKNIPNYLNKVNQIYLLITEGFIPNSWIGDFENNGVMINNRFDKIFLLKVMSHNLYELK